jgi:hypothetical protein
MTGDNGELESGNREKTQLGLPLLLPEGRHLYPGRVGHPMARCARRRGLRRLARCRLSFYLALGRRPSQHHQSDPWRDCHDS